MQLFVLSGDGLRLLVALLFQRRHVLVQVGHHLVEFGDVDVLGVKLLAKALELLVLDGHLLSEVVDDLLQLLAPDGALAHLLLQLVDEFLVLLHDALDELHVLADALRGVRALALLGQRHTVLGLGNLAEALLDVAEGGHHVVDLIVFL